MTENLLIPQRMLYQIPEDSMCMKIDKEGKGSVSIHVYVCLCQCVETDRQTDRHGDKETKKMEGQSGIEEKKMIKRSRIDYFTFAQRSTEWTCSCGVLICTYVFTPHGIRPSDLSDKFCSIEANLNDVVKQSKGWRQWEGSHEQRHKPVLDY